MCTVRDTGIGKSSIPRLRELASLPEAGSRNLGIELFPNPVVYKYRQLFDLKINRQQLGNNNLSESDEKWAAMAF